MHKRNLGQQMENHAQGWLEQRGLRFVEKNFYTPLGEIDLIMQQEDSQLVFVEVRYRKNQTFGGAVASITAHKIKKIKLAAKQYLLKHQLYDKIACRFDVIAMTMVKDQLNVEWIKNAF